MKIKQTQDGQHILASGIYPPMIKVFGTSDLSLKFKRHVDAQVVQFEVLTDDLKLILLRSDRVLEFHAKFGTHYKTRLPSICRDMTYQYATCDLFTVGNTHEIQRMNVAVGRFLKPFNTTMTCINCCTINPASGILAVGGTDRAIECWDPRDSSHLASMKIALDNVDGVDKSIDVLSGNLAIFDPYSSTTGVTCLKFSPDGLSLAVGTHTGHCLLYDLRSNIPIHVKDHQFDTAVTSIDFHEPSRNIVSSCKKIIKVWNKDTGDNFVNIEPTWNMNTVSVVKDSGMILAGGENSQIDIYYIPELGRAPFWAPFLENITEELEPTQEKGSIYHDYKFVTSNQLEQLGASGLIGTPYLRSYMHGFFINVKLYTKLCSIVRPDEYKEYLQERVRERIEAKRISRISVNDASKIQVNKKYLESLATKKGQTIPQVLHDDRFGRMWKDPAMNLDPKKVKFQHTFANQFSVVGEGGSAINETELLYANDEGDDEYHHLRRGGMMDLPTAPINDQSNLDSALDDAGHDNNNKNAKFKHKSKIWLVDPISSKYKSQPPEKSQSQTRKATLLEATDRSLMGPFRNITDDNILEMNVPFVKRLQEPEMRKTYHGPLTHQPTIGSMAMSFKSKEDQEKELKMKNNSRVKMNKERRSMKKFKF